MTRISHYYRLEINSPETRLFNELLFQSFAYDGYISYVAAYITHCKSHNGDNHREYHKDDSRKQQNTARQHVDSDDESMTRSPIYIGEGKYC